MVTLNVTVTAPNKIDLGLKAVIIKGAGEFGPSDHVPSYSDLDPSPQNAQFRVPIAQGEAFGCLVLHQETGGIVWTGVFHRVTIEQSQTETHSFLDTICKLEVTGAPRTDAVVLKQELAAGPDGKPCYAYSVTGQSSFLIQPGVTLTLLLSVASHPRPANLAVYRKSGATSWTLDASTLSGDQKVLKVPIRPLEVYAIRER
jgi:hypothetical protein